MAMPRYTRGARASGDGRLHPDPAEDPEIEVGPSIDLFDTGLVVLAVVVLVAISVVAAGNSPPSCPAVPLQVHFPIAVPVIVDRAPLRNHCRRPVVAFGARVRLVSRRERIPRSLIDGVCAPVEGVRIVPGLLVAIFLRERSGRSRRSARCLCSPACSLFAAGVAVPTWPDIS